MFYTYDGLKYQQYQRWLNDNYDGDKIMVILMIMMKKMTKNIQILWLLSQNWLILGIVTCINFWLIKVGLSCDIDKKLSEKAKLSA